MSNHDLDREVELLVESFSRIPVDTKTNANTIMTTTAEHLRVLVDIAISAALKVQREEFERQIDDIKNKFNTFSVSTPEIESYRDIEIIPGSQCDESLDVVKSLPDFEGKHELYISWRQAAHTAYKLFESYDGSSKHYQAVAIIRNKIKGSADMVLSSFNTVLNFKAIIARLDFTYSDKRPIYLIEQELSTLRQGSKTLLEYYDEVEKKLTLLTNKCTMTYDSVIANSMKEKYRMDALRVFISGTKKDLSNILFSARPSDLPSALALAQEVESNRERYLFASNFCKSREDRDRQKGEPQSVHGNVQNKNPHFARRLGAHKDERHLVEPMDVDQSAQFRQPTRFKAATKDSPQGQYNHNQNPTQPSQNQPNWQAVKRPNSGTARYTGPKHQRVNHLSQYDPGHIQDYHHVADIEADDVEIDAQDEFEQINFLVAAPCYRS